MANCYLSETGHNKVNLMSNILAYSEKIRHIMELSRDIQTHSEGCVTPVCPEPWNIQNLGIFRILAYSKHIPIQNPAMFRTLGYSETWYIQNFGIFRTVVYSELWHMQNLGIFGTLAYSETWYIQNFRIFRTLV